LARVLATGWIPESHNGSRTDLAALKDMTSMLIGRFVQTVGMATRAKYGDGPLTRYAADLVIPEGVRAECAVLKGTAAHFLMFTDERRALMGDQRTQIHELVDAFRAQPQTRLDPLHRVDYLGAADDGAALRVIIDQVASLSDPRAKALHQSWC
jgi:dGTPase